MDIFAEMRFDGFCVRTLAAMGALAAALVCVSLSDGGAIPYAARCAGVFVWGLCACGLMSLYFDMLAYSAAAVFYEWSSVLFAAADSAALAFKLLFVLAPFALPDEDELFLRFAALTADAFLSRAHLRYTQKRLEKAASGGR